MVDFLHINGYLILFISIVYYEYFKKYIGGADLLIFSLLITRYGFYNVSLILFYAAIIALIYSLLLRKEKLRFIPFILIGFLMFLKGGQWK